MLWFVKTTKIPGTDPGFRSVCQSSCSIGFKISSTFHCSAPKLRSRVCKRRDKTEWPEEVLDFFSALPFFCKGLDVQVQAAPGCCC